MRIKRCSPDDGDRIKREWGIKAQRHSMKQVRGGSNNAIRAQRHG